MNINNLIKEAYEIAKLKGWHDEPIAFADYIANIHAEISEAWEEWRNNKGLDEIYYECTEKEPYPYNCIDNSVNCDCSTCKYAKPCGIPIELADVVIWICDMFGEYDKEKSLYPNTTKPFPGIEFSNFVNWCHDFVNDGTLESLEDLIIYIENYCTVNGIDIEKAIELKMAYNKIRPVRHGGKRV